MSKGVTCSLETDGRTDEVITVDTLSGSQDFPSTSHQGAVQLSNFIIGSIIHLMLYYLTLIGGYEMKTSKP